MAKKETSLFVGTYIPQKEDDCLRMFSLLHSIPKSKMFLGMLKRWRESNNITRPKMIRECINKELALCSCVAEADKEAHYTQRAEFLLTKLNPELVSEILKQVKDEEDKRTKIERTDEAKDQ